MPTRRATAPAVVALSPVIIQDIKPERLQFGDRLGRGRFDRIGDRNQPARLPSTAT